MISSDRKAIVHTEEAPEAIGPYSQAARSGALVFTAGQIGLDPASGELVEGGVQAETRQALTNLTHVLAAAGSKMDLVLKTTVFLADMQDFGVMNAIYAEFFPEQPPARSTVGVASLPKGARVEIEVIAAVAAARGD